MLVVSHESVGIVAFSLWAVFEVASSPGPKRAPGDEVTFEATPLQRQRLWAWLVRLPRSLVDPVPNESLLGEFVNFLQVKGLK